MWRLRRFPLVLMQDGCRAIGELPSPLWAGLSHMLRMVPLARTRRICPLPLRERAARYFSEEEGVRGSFHNKACYEEAPHPSFCVDPFEQPSPTGGEGAATTTALADRARCYLCPCGSISLDELITAWMLRAYSTAPVTSMSSAARA